MALEVEPFIEQARSRNDLIPSLINKKQVYMPADPAKSSLAMTLCSVFISGLEVFGTRYLEEASRLVDAGKKLTIVSNHQSDADHTIRRYICEKLGFKGLSDTFFFLGGLKMIERKSIQRLMPAENTVFVLTPADARNLAAAYRRLKKGQLDPQQAGIVETYIKNCRALSEASSAATEEQIKLGKTLFFYPEGTRTRDKQRRIQRAPKGVTKLFPPDEDTYVLPLMVDGPANIMTLEDKFKPDRTKIKAVIGKPYPAGEIFEVDIKGVRLNGSPATSADVVMARLGILMPELIPADSIGFYGRMLETYNPIPEFYGRYYSSSFFDRFEETLLHPLFQRLFAEVLQRANLTSG